MWNYNELNRYSMKKEDIYDWLFINLETWTIEAYQRNFDWINPAILNPKDDLDNQSDLDCVESMERIWYYLVWFTDTEWMLPIYIWVELYSHVKHLDLKYKYIWYADESRYMIFAKIPGMNPKIIPSEEKSQGQTVTTQWNIKSRVKTLYES